MQPNSLLLAIGYIFSFLNLTVQNNVKTGKNAYENYIFYTTQQNSGELINHNRIKHSVNFLLDEKLNYCQKPAKCIESNLTCLGVKLPYASTSLNLTGSPSLDIVQDQLHQYYQILRQIPKCWTVIQPFLCSLYMPRCENNLVFLPSYEMCRITLGPCKILYDLNFFPDFFKCDLFETKCRNDIREQKFNTTGKCVEPLIKTDSTDWFYKGVEGCGLQCKDTLFTDNEHQQIHKLVFWGAAVCLLANAFTVATFIIDWQSANKYPALVIFYINTCFLISCVGWLAQFYGPDSRDDIVCKKNGLLRISEPSAGENLSCVLVFVLVYYFSMAGLVWFVILTYAWHMSFQAIGKIQERIDKKRAYFHLVAWSLPLMLTITTMALGEIDGDSVTGICFVGHINPAARGGLLLGPLTAAMFVGGYFLSKGLYTLISLKIGSKDIISVKASMKIRSTIIRMGIFTILSIIYGLTTFVCHIHEFINRPKWNGSLDSYITCRLTNLESEWDRCKLAYRPSIGMLQLQLLALYAAGVTMGSWVWTHATVDAWKRYIRRKFDCEVEEPARLQKHKVIARAFAKRKKLLNAGRISISFHNTHTDPVGLNFDLDSDSAGSNDFSSTWAAALPKLVNRRGAVTGLPTCSVSSHRRNSMDSEISFSVRRVSVESRRNSVDSQLSVQIAELKTTRKVNGSRSGRHNRNRSKRRREFSGRRISRTYSSGMHRRESSTSLDSQLGNQILNVLAIKNQNIVPNLSNRRTAIADIDRSNLDREIMLKLPCQSSDSEEENVSMTVSENKFNLVVSGHNGLDLNDELVVKSLKRGFRIDEIISSDGNHEERHHRKRAYSRSDRESRSSKRSIKRDSHRNRVYRKSDRYEDNTDDSCDDHRKKPPLSDNYSSMTSFCPELSNLAMQSSLNSAMSAGTQHNYEKNRGSKQSKTSIDVGVQANAREIATQTLSAYEDLEMVELAPVDDESIRQSKTKSQCVSQGTQMSPIIAKRCGSSSPKQQRKHSNRSKKKNHSEDDCLERSVRKNRRNYERALNAQENEPLRTKKIVDSDDSQEVELLLKDRSNVKIVKHY